MDNLTWFITIYATVGVLTSGVNALGNNGKTFLRGVIIIPLLLTLFPVAKFYSYLWWLMSGDSFTPKNTKENDGK